MLTERDREILLALTHKVRVLSLGQIARTWWHGTSGDQARRRLAGIVAGGFLERLTVNAHPELALNEPLFEWQPGGEPPNVYALEYRLRSRFREHARPTLLYYATRRAAASFGGAGGRLKHPLQTDHDLHVSTVYLRLREIDPETAAAWVSEDLFAKERRRQKLPDAILRDDDGGIRRVIEFAGRYDAARLKAFHADCASRGTPYELW